MNRIIESVESDKNNFDLDLEQQQRTSSKQKKLISTTDAITSAAYTIARTAEAKAIVTFSLSGKTTLRMAKERAPVLIIGLSPNIKTARKTQLVWGVYSNHTEQDAQNTTEMVSIACKTIKEKKLANIGDSIVITAGVPFGNAGSTNLLRIAKIIDNKDLT
jgi:pyruvate kinase